MKLVRARAHASIANLGYGFDSFGVAVTLSYDDVTLRRAARGVAVEVTGPGAEGVPARPRANTACVALAKLMRDHGVPGGVHVSIRKGAGTGGGLGSSAASAAAAVAAGNRLFALGLSRAALVPYAAHGETAAAGAAHVDNVAAALLGGVTIADPAEPAAVVRLAAPAALRFAVAVPRLALTTRAARGVLPRRVALADYTRGVARSGAIVAALAAGDLAALGHAIEGSVFERARARLVPGYAAVCAAARAAGATGATLSGAGPAIAAVVDARRGDARAVAEAMRAAFRLAGVDAAAFSARVAPGVRVTEARA